MASPIILVMCDHLSLPNKSIVPRSTSFWARARLEPLDEFRSVQQVEWWKSCSRSPNICRSLLPQSPNGRSDRRILAGRSGQSGPDGNASVGLDRLRQRRFPHVLQLHRAIPPRRAAFEAQSRILVKVVQKMSVALAAGHEELRHALPQQPMLHRSSARDTLRMANSSTSGAFMPPAPRGSPSFTSTPASCPDILKQFLGEELSAGWSVATTRVVSAVSPARDGRQAAILLGRHSILAT